MSDGWHPIETVPFNRRVDLWCIDCWLPFSSWDGKKVIGRLHTGALKHLEYGWFGKQSNDGIPQRDGPDLIPVAWREPVPDCPVSIVEAFLASMPQPAPEAP